MRVTPSRGYSIPRRPRPRKKHTDFTDRLHRVTARWFMRQIGVRCDDPAHRLLPVLPLPTAGAPQVGVYQCMYLDPETNDHKLVMQALLAGETVKTEAEASKLTDALLDAQREWLPQFFERAR